MKTKLTHLAIGAITALASMAASADLVLPPGVCNGQNCLQFTDFSVYSLTLLNGGATPQPGDNYYVSSASGQIKDYVVLGVNNGGQAQTNISGVDDAYNTPSANNTSTFTTQTTDTGGGPGAGDGNSWQASVASLRSQFLNSKFVGFFAFNETGGGSSNTTALDGGPDLLVWAKVTLKDLQDPSHNKSFYLQSAGSALNDDPLASALPPSNAVDGSTGPWAYVHGSVCMNGTTFTGFPVNGVCALGSPKAQTNLGANNAAFAIYNAALDAEIHNVNTLFDVVQIDWEMAYLNGGGETAWFQAAVPEDSSSVPEPGILALVGAALGLIGWSRRRARG